MRSWRSAFALIGLGMLLILCSGCGTTNHERRGISLGGVVEEASKEPDEQSVVAPDTTPVSVEPVVFEDDADFENQRPVLPQGIVAVDKEGQPAAPLDTVLVPSGTEQPPQDQPIKTSSGEEEDGWFFGALFGGGGLTGDAVKGFWIGGISVGTTQKDGRIRWEAQGLVGSADMKADSLARGLKNEFTLGFGLAGYYHLTPPHTFMGLYALGGLRTSLLRWDYENPVEVETDVGTETIGSDYLGYFELYAGLGVSLAQGKRARLGINASGGVRLYNNSTHEGFDNDLFHNEALFQVMLDVVFGKLRQ